MIIKVRKAIIFGIREEIETFFSRAQEQGFIEFISLSSKKELRQPEEVEKFIAAVKLLKKFSPHTSYSGSYSQEKAEEIAWKVLELQQDIDKLSEEKRLLEAESVRVAPFGDFSREDIDFIEREGKLKLQFFCMKSAESHKTNFTDDVIYIGTEYDLDYFLTINQEAAKYPGMIEMRIDRALGELQNRLEFVKESSAKFEAELRQNAHYLPLLKQALVALLDNHNLQCAKEKVNFPLEPHFFTVEAWIPENKIATFYTLIQPLAVHAEEVAIEEHEKIPTCLENQGLDRLGEDVIRIYDIPAHTDKDPSRWVLWAFALFFAMIVADAGYGLIFFILALYLKKKFPKVHGSTKRTLNLFFLLSLFCIGWGVITASYFGIQLSPSNPLSKYSLLHALAEKKADYHFRMGDVVHQQWIEDYPNLAGVKNGHELLATAVTESGSYEMLSEFSENILLEFSLLIGIFHVSFGFLRYLRHHWAAVGWILFLFGAYFYLPSFLEATSLVNILGWIDKKKAAEIGLQLVCVGFSLAIFLGFLQNKWKGISEPLVLIQVFADVLSYLRLYALALASSMMASTFNNIGEILGLVIGLLFLFIGHIANLAMSVMGGVIHGLRLNFLEWYHYCFEGGGRLFNPLRRIK